MKNPQTTIAPTFLTHIISAIDGVLYLKKQRFGDTVWFPEGLENTPFKGNLWKVLISMINCGLQGILYSVHY